MTTGLYASPLEDKDGVHYYNPALAELNGYRCIFPRKRYLPNVDQPHGFNQVMMSRLEKDNTWKEGKVLQLDQMAEWQHMEDPRVIKIGNQGHFLLGVSTFIRYPNNTWSGSHQAVGMFDIRGDCIWSSCPPLGGNSRTVMIPVTRQEKNWCWFECNGKLCVLYSAYPKWIVCEFEGYPWEDERAWHIRKDYVLPPVTWGYGEIHGGTPPVLVDNMFWTFFHSWTPWPEGHNVRYYAGALAFEAKPPFWPRLLTTFPLLSGEPLGLMRKDVINDQRKEKLVVLPSGALLYPNGKWLVTSGINDQRCGWMTIDHQDVQRLSKDVVC